MDFYTYWALTRPGLKANSQKVLAMMLSVCDDDYILSQLDIKGLIWDASKTNVGQFIKLLEEKKFIETWPDPHNKCNRFIRVLFQENRNIEKNSEKELDFQASWKRLQILRGDING